MILYFKWNQIVSFFFFFGCFCLLNNPIKWELGQRTWQLPENQRLKTNRDCLTHSPSHLVFTLLDSRACQNQSVYFLGMFTTVDFWLCKYWADCPVSTDPVRRFGAIWVYDGRRPAGPGALFNLESFIYNLAPLFS